jgi:hypothetical protein
LRAKFIAETFHTLNNWQPGPSDISYILDNKYTLHLHFMLNTGRP